MSVPFRGWYILDNNKNMEGNGAQPDLLVWPEPREMPTGVDKQMKAAVQLLLKGVK